MIKDSNGILKSLTHQFGWRWTTVFDFKHAMTEHGASNW